VDVDFYSCPALGDLGGPVLHWSGRFWEQVGIIGYNARCRQSDHPGVYTRLSAYWQWMEDILSSTGEHLEPQRLAPSWTTTTMVTDTSPATSRTVFSNDNSTMATPTMTTTSRATSNAFTYECDRIATKCGCSMRDVVVAAIADSSVVAKRTSENIHAGSWSMIVSVHVADREYPCVGTILSDTFVLTTAKCVANVSRLTDITIAAGRYDLSQNATSVHRVDRISIHENYTTSLHDMALLRLEQPIRVDGSALFSRTCLPRPDAFMENVTMISVGWTQIRVAENMPNMLQQLPVRSISLPNARCFNSLYLEKYQFCAGSRSNGQGKRAVVART
jgi:secreted trypsin-like serine protease